MRNKKNLLNSKKLWAPVLVLLLALFVIVAIFPAGKFSMLSFNEQSLKNDEPTTTAYNSRENIISRDYSDMENIKKVLDVERKRIEFLQPTHSKNVYYRFESPPNGEDCIKLNQSFFNEHENEDILFSYEEGCVELTEDIFFNNTIILSGGLGGFYFTCKNYTITGHPYFTNPAFLLNESVTVKDCKIEWANTGFSLYDSSQVIDSVVQYGYVGEAYNMFDFSSVQRSAAINVSTGFVTRDFSTVSDSIADGNLAFGFNMLGNSSVSRSWSHGSMINFEGVGNVTIHDSSAEGGMEGFSLRDSASASNITSTGAAVGIDLINFAQVSDAISYGNGWGFMLHGTDLATVLRGTAHNNNVGFELGNGADITDVLAEQNGKGFVISGNPQLNGLTVRDNEYGFEFYGSTTNGLTSLNNTYGFSLYDTQASALTAMDSTEAGFVLYGSSSLDASLAHGSVYGFRLYDSSIISNSRAEENNYGFELYGNSIVTGSTASDNRHHGFMLHDTSQVSDVTALRNGEAENDYGILLQDITTATNVVSDNNANGVFVEGCGYQPSRLLEGRRVCNNGVHDIYVSGGYVEGTFQTSGITGSNCWDGNWSGVNILPCSGGGGGKPPLPVQQYGEGGY